MTQFDTEAYADWRRFTGGKREFVPKAVPPVILDSWNRSRDFGVDPFSSGFQSVSPSELKRRRMLKADLCKVATPYIRNLYEVIRGSGSLIILADEDGVVIDLGSDDASHSIRNFPEAGTIQSESVVGTNGIGTAIASRSLVQIRGAEHWLLDNHAWTCNAAPILVGTKLIGCLNLSTPSRRQNSLSMGLVGSAVTAIVRELELSSTLKEVRYLTEQQNAILKLMENGVIFISRAGRIVQSNERAHAILKDRRDWDGLHVSDVLKCNLDFMAVFDSGNMLEAHEISLLLQRKNAHLHVSTEVINIGEGSEAMALLLYESKKMLKMVNKIVGSTAHFRFEDIVGASPAMVDCLRLARQTAAHDSNVLLMGESGTGKELIAQSIHNASTRKDEPFIAVNCGALSRELILSELFGYEGGAFTGAKSDGNPGKFELANGGTILLDEIGELPLESQVALLRVLQTREVTRIGSGRTKAIDVRVIAATNKDLARCVADKSFREDLFFRINTFTIRLPPLRGRQGDLALLIEKFMDRHRAHSNRPGLRLTEACLPFLEGYAWPGNIRQLENVIERAAMVCEGDTIVPGDLPNEISERMAGPAASARAEPFRMDEPAGSDFEAVEREYLREKLFEVEGNLRELAALLKLSRSTIYRKIQRFNLDPNEFRGKERVC